MLGNEEPRSTSARCTKKGNWNRALVLDTESGFVDIQRESDVDGSEYQKLKLRKGQKKVLIYMQQDKQNRLKTENFEKNDVFLAKLSLDHLGLANRALLLFGCLTTLYVSAP
ncbi:uncharacterized protein M421DRAFT_419052 [Didymella exigua CBS 183.55]|uniref:Uncharacterized protein n=1 Tax=Didymella exigua CBS 183.55 TaxID=1150837 RepID=A0A6A5RSF4_9PLEO|nr:uncharacterized protein M421DRAFT_419052 [Didymella exigua CBS 183.55]KAF1930024.1 hypothetical protein M421DRAFT_419052 [Didymella exigua CBS 183.55]